MISLFAAIALAQDPIEEDFPEDPEPAPAPAPAPAAPVPPPPPVPKGPVTQAQIQAAANTWYGKQVPTAAICVGRPKVPAAITKEVVAVGVMRKNAGCRLVGVMVAGEPVATADALAAAVDLPSLDTATRIPTARDWVTGVLLHFDRPMNEGVGKLTPKGGVAVTAGYLHRTDEFHVSEKVPGQFTFDAAGKLVGTAGTATEKWRTDLYQQEVAVQGLSSAVVDSAVKSVGASITECFEDKIAADPGFAGATRIAMVVAAGKIEKLGAEEESDPDLTRCYANALYRAVWSPTAKGSAVWSFAIVKAPL
jgi:hypothetical protein